MSSENTACPFCEEKQGEGEVFLETFWKLLLNRCSVYYSCLSAVPIWLALAEAARRSDVCPSAAERGWALTLSPAGWHVVSLFRAAFSPAFPWACLEQPLRRQCLYSLALAAQFNPLSVRHPLLVSEWWPQPVPQWHCPQPQCLSLLHSSILPVIQDVSQSATSSYPVLAGTVCYNNFSKTVRGDRNQELTYKGEGQFGWNAWGW